MKEWSHSFTGTSQTVAMLDKDWNRPQLALPGIKKGDPKAAM